MSAERVIEVGMPFALRQPSGALERKLSEDAGLLWSELGLSSRPRVAVTGRAPAGVAVDGRPVPISARRIEQAILTGSGNARRPGEADAPYELLTKRLQDPDLDTAANVAACLVDVALRANVAALVRAESTAIAQRLILAIGDGAPPLEVLSDAVACAAEHGIIPRQLDIAAELAGDAAAPGPDMLSENLIRSWLKHAPPRPVIEANPATLRRLTTGGRVFHKGSSPIDYRRDLFVSYGVRPPAPSLRATSEPGPVVRFNFGNSRTAGHLVLPDGQAVYMVSPDALPPSSGARPFVDPVEGEVWSLVDLPVDDWCQPELLLDSAALLTRSLQVEMKTRLPLWSPTFAELSVFDWPWIDGERLHLDEASGALRWLLSAQGSVHLLARLMEGVVTAAAEGVRGPAAIAAWLRSFLGRAVLGPLAASSSYTLIELDDLLAREAAESASPAPVLDRHPALITATQQLVVACPSRWRRDVECLLRPLSDIAVVAANEELALLPVVT